MTGDCNRNSFLRIAEVGVFQQQGGWGHAASRPPIFPSQWRWRDHDRIESDATTASSSSAR